MRDLDALMPLPMVPYDACGKVSTRATSISMARYRNNDCSVPVAYAHHEVQVRGYVGEFVIGCGGAGSLQVVTSDAQSSARGALPLNANHLRK